MQHQQDSENNGPTNSGQKLNDVTESQPLPTPQSTKYAVYVQPLSKSRIIRITVWCILIAFVFGFCGSAVEKLISSRVDDMSLISREQPEEIEQSEQPEVVEKIVEPEQWSDTVEKIKDSVVEIYTQKNGRSHGAGSGVILSKDGYIVTNYHVIERATKIDVTLTNGKEYEAEVIGSDDELDIALIKISAFSLKPAFLGKSSSVRPGDKVIAIGNPLGYLGGTVTEGIVSAVDRPIDEYSEEKYLLQFSAPINGGNSGGGLFDADGKLIGIVTAKMVGVGVEGLGFAIPIDSVIEIIIEIFREVRTGD